MQQDLAAGFPATAHRDDKNTLGTWPMIESGAAETIMPVAAGAAIYDGDLFADQVLADSNAVYRELRELGDAVWVPDLGLYVVARYADVSAGLRANDTLISGEGVSVNAMLNGKDAPAGATSTITSDGERHRQLKRLEMRPLMPASVRELRETLVALAEEAIDGLATGEPFEAMSRLASYLPIKVVADLVGIKGIGPDKMLEWSGAVFDAFGPAHHSRTGAALPTILEFSAYGSRLTRDDVVPGSWADRVLEAGEKGELTMQEARDLVFDYVLPSLDTTIYSTGELLYQLARIPGSLDTLRARPELIPGILNEAVRLSSPLRGFTRLAVQDYTFTETTIPAGSRVWLLYASANRDERHFPDPDRFDMERNPRDHVGWGQGVHMCSGMHLARLEMEVIVDVLTRKVRAMEAGAPTRIVNNAAQGYATLPLTLHPA